MRWGWLFVAAVYLMIGTGASLGLERAKDRELSPYEDALATLMWPISVGIGLAHGTVRLTALQPTTPTE